MEIQMDKTTREAHEGSVRKWDRILAGEGKDERNRNCPLCKLFPYRCENSKGEKCPVYQKTGFTNCNKTPYREWLAHHNEHHYTFIHCHKIECPTCGQLADNEVKFLKSFLPKEEAKMKTVVFKDRAQNEVDIENVSSDKIYGYRFKNGGKTPRLLRQIDNKYRWIIMEDCTSGNSFNSLNKTESLTEAIKEIHNCYPEAPVHEFNSMNEFYKWATEGSQNDK